MPKQLFLNNWDWTFIAPVKATPTTGTPDTELGYGILQINSAASVTLIAPTGGDWYMLTAYKKSGSVESQYEIIKVLGVDEAGYVAGGECRIRVERAQEGTTAQAYVASDFISLRFTKGGATNFLQSSQNLADVASASTARTNLGLGSAAVAASTDFAPVAHVGAGGAEHANVVAGGAAGFMTGTDKTKLDGVATGATANTGTVTTASVITGNGFAGSVANPTTTPAITITTSVTGLVKGNGTALSAAVAGADYLAPPAGTSILKANSGGALANAAAADITGQLLTGYVSGAGTVAATDTILQAINKLNGNDGLKANLVSPTFTTPNIGVATGTSFNSITGLSAVVGTAHGTAAVGVATAAARADHVHPVQTSITGNAATVTTNANLTGHITSVGNAAVLGSFTLAQLNTAISDADVATGGGTATGTNTGDNATNSQYASDYRAANFVAGTNYQVPLVSGTNIKTINGASVLGSGDLVVGGSGAGGGSSTSSAVDITLTSASDRVQSVTMTAPDKKVTTPNATTLDEGGALFVLKNAGTLAYAVRSNGGALLANLQPEQIATFYLTDNSTAAGTWVVGRESTNGEFGVPIPAPSGVTTVQALASGHRSVALSATTGIQIVSNASGFPTAIPLAIDAAGAITPGTPYPINSDTSINVYAIKSINSTQALATWQLNTGVTKSCVLTLSGGTVTAGTVYTVLASAAASNISVVVLSSTLAVLAYSVVTTAYQGVISLGISGTVVTANTPLTVNAIASNNSNTLAALTATTALLSFQNPAGGGINNYVLTTSGATITAGTLATTPSSGARPTSCKVTSDTVLLLYCDQTVNTRIIPSILKVSGTSCLVSEGPPLAIYGGPSPLPAVVLTSPSSAVLFCGGGSNSYAQAHTLSITGLVSVIGSTGLLTAVNASNACVSVLSTGRVLASVNGASSYPSAVVLECAV